MKIFHNIDRVNIITHNFIFGNSKVMDAILIYLFKIVIIDYYLLLSTIKISTYYELFI